MANISLFMVPCSVMSLGKIGYGTTSSFQWFNPYNGKISLVSIFNLFDHILFKRGTVLTLNNLLWIQIHLK